jgi:hypothetical protein
MVTEHEVKELAANSKGSGKTLAEFLAELYKDKFLEIYVGDSYEEISVDQVSTSYPAVFCGKVVAAYRECLVINCVFTNQANKLELGNMVCISERAIRALNEVDGRGTLEDMLLRSKETLLIKELFIDPPRKMRLPPTVQPPKNK